MKKLFLLLILISLSGCNKDKIVITLDMNCNNTISELKVKYNDTLYCKVNDKEYNLLVTDISEDEIIFEDKDKEYTLTIDKNIEKDGLSLSWKK